MLSLVLAAALSFTEAHAELAYATARDLVESCTPRDAGTIRGRVAANFLLDKASVTGADVRRDVFTAETPDGARTFTNLTCEFRNAPTGSWVVVVSHFDTKPGVKCPGANDGASTSGLLVALADVLESCRDLKDNVMLIWTDGEECMNAYGENDGFWGSKHAARNLKDKGYEVRAVVCLDMLGDRDLKIGIPGNGSAALTKLVLTAAKKAGLSDWVCKMPEFVKDDHVAFMDMGFASIDLIDFDYGSKPGVNDYWHTEKDTMDNVSKASLLKSGSLVVAILNALHRTPQAD